MVRLLTLFLGFIGAMLSQPLIACGLCSGNPYAGAYSTGGYNLYSFATDLYTIVDTTYYVSPVSTGGCGSLMGTCNPCYDSAGLYGNPSNQLTHSLVNQLLMNQIAQNSAQMCMISGMCNPTNPYLPGLDPFSPVMPPIAGMPGAFPTPYFPPVVGPNFPYAPNNPYDPYNPFLPYNPYQPYSPIAPLNPYTPPQGPLPYGGCDNVVVMCPPGPVVRTPWDQPSTTPVFVSNPTSGATNPTYTFNPPVINGPAPNDVTPINPIGPITIPTPTPTHGSDSQPVPQSPVRFQTPRGGVARPR